MLDSFEQSLQGRRSNCSIEQESTDSHTKGSFIVGNPKFCLAVFKSDSVRPRGRDLKKKFG